MSNETITNEAPKPGTKPYLEAQLAAANAEIEELKAKAAEAEAKAKAAETKPVDGETQEAVAAPKREKIYIPRAAHSKDDPNLVVGFNGKLYVLPKGKESEVPAEVAAEIRRSWRAADRYEQTRENKLAEVAQAEAQMKQKIN